MSERQVKLEELYTEARSMYDDQTISFDKIHKRVCEGFMGIMKEGR